MNTKTAIAVVVALVVVAGAAFFLMGNREPLGEMAPVVPAEQKASMKVYSNADLSLSFEYPSNLFLYERNDVGTEANPQTAVMLVEDTQENRDVLEGRSTEPREGPTGISITVFENPQKLNAADWVTNDTNWTVANSSATPVTVNGREGVSFTWSGLYEGRTVIVTTDTHAYAFSVTWMTPEDQIIRDFDMVLNSATF